MSENPKSDVNDATVAIRVDGHFKVVIISQLFFFFLHYFDMTGSEKFVLK